MPTYVWTAKDKSGRSVVKEVAHSTVQCARDVLLAEGCTELKLIGDEVVDAAVAGFTDKCTVFGEEIKVTAEARVKHMAAPPTSVWRVLGQGLGQSKTLVLLAVLLAGYQLYRGQTSSVALTVFALLSWIAFITYAGLPGVYYGKLHKAADWYRWTEVLQTVGTLKKLRRFHFIKVPVTELLRYRAAALAGLGDLGTALDEYRQCENRPGCPSWLYKAHVAGLHDLAKRHDKALEYTLQSLRENPIPALYLDLANRLLRYKRDPIRAREALAEAEKATLTEIAKPFHLRCRGILAYLEGDWGAAKRELEASLGIMLRTLQQPYRDGHISIARSYLCCVLVELGDRAAAQQCLDQAKAYLVATREDDLLAECQKALAST
jgi:tetratricopeptide (TPR) repeat protein